MIVKPFNNIAPNFRSIIKSAVKEEYSEYWLKGGRGSTKSSVVGIAIPKSHY